MGAPIELPEPPSGSHGIRVGVGGWTFAPWRDNFYPAGLPHRRELEYASRALTAIEVNGTFYGAQKPATYARWREETPDGFVFSLKAPRYCTEARQLAGVGRSIERFVFGGLAELGDRLGPILWRFPPRHGFERDDFAAFLDLLPAELEGRRLRHVLDARHSGFACEAFLALARAHGCATVYTDSPEYPSFSDLTADFVYARLMRSREQEPDGYPPAELDAWATRAQLWAQGGEPEDLPRVGSGAAPVRKREVFIYFISAAKPRNPAAARALLARL